MSWSSHWLDTWFSFFFFFNDTATTEIYTLSLHDALPISLVAEALARAALAGAVENVRVNVQSLSEPGLGKSLLEEADRSEEHTSELQSQSNLVCRLLLEKKKT